MSRLTFGIRALAVLALLLAAATPAVAQPAERGAVFGGVTSLREMGAGGSPAVDYDLGWMAGVELPIGLWRFTAAGDIGVNRRRNIVDEVQQLTGLTGGLRATILRVGGARLFAHALVGVEDFSEPGFSEAGVAVQPGGGLDVGITERLAARVQADLRVSRQADATYRSWRLMVGAALRW